MTFALSVNSETPSIAGYILLGIWIVGIFAMIILVIKSSLRLRIFGEICDFPFRTRRFADCIIECLKEMGIHKEYPCVQYCIFEIPDYCRTFETMYLSADSSDL